MKKIFTIFFAFTLFYTPVNLAQLNFNPESLISTEEELDKRNRRGRRFRGGGRRFRGGGRRFRGGGRGRRYRGGRRFSWHRPGRNFRRHRRFYGPRRFFNYLPSRYIYLNRWVRYGSECYDGQYYYQNYPWYCSDGYLHRYSHLDDCNYHLVDLRSNEVVESFSNYACNTGYDLCADLRDSMNEQVGDGRYFCSERYR